MSEIYDPKTAFGNPELIALKKKLIEPDEDGEYTIPAEVHENISYELRWQCQKCNFCNCESDFDGDMGAGDNRRECPRCKTVHNLTI